MSSHNKGKRFIICPKCNRKRYCSFSPLPNGYRKIICSRGHEWIIKLSTLERVNNALVEQMLPRMLDLFNRDDIFFASLKNRR